MKKLFSAAMLSLLIASASLAQSNAVKGEIKKIDKAQGKVTVKHGPIKNLDMDDMTMVFRVKDPKMLDAVAVGDKVDFEADRVNGQLTIIKIEKAKK